LRLQSSNDAGDDDQGGKGDGMTGRRLQESGPGEFSLDENVVPERGGSRAEFERRHTAGENDVAQVGEECPGPGRELDQQARNGRGVRDFEFRPGQRHLSIVDARAAVGIAGRAWAWGSGPVMGTSSMIDRYE